MDQTDSAVREICDRCRTLGKQSFRPNIPEAHRLTRQALEGIGLKAESLPEPMRRTFLYVFYEEMLMKTAEFQTVIDMLSNRCSDSEADIDQAIQKHMNTALA